ARSPAFTARRLRLRGRAFRRREPLRDVAAYRLDRDFARTAVAKAVQRPGSQQLVSSCVGAREHLPSDLWLDDKRPHVRGRSARNRHCQSSTSYLGRVLTTANALSLFVDGRYLSEFPSGELSTNVDSERTSRFALRQVSREA